MGRPIVVTGGAGRLGTLVKDRLRQEGRRVVSVSRASPEHPDDWQLDVREAATLSTEFRALKPSAVLHLAGVRDVADAASQNAALDEAVAWAVRSAEVPNLIYSSSCAVYGTASPAALSEEAPLMGATPYAQSKIYGEKVFRRLSLENPHLGVTVLRIFNVAGPTFPSSLVMRLLDPKATAPVTLVEPDHFIRDYIHQSEAASLILMATELRRPGYFVVNVGAGVPVSTRRLLASLDVVAPYTEISGPSTSSWADTHRMSRTFGLQPTALPTRQWAATHLGAP